MLTISLRRPSNWVHLFSKYQHLIWMNHKNHFANLKDIWKISTQLPFWSDVMPEWNSEPSQPGWKLSWVLPCQTQPIMCSSTTTMDVCSNCSHWLLFVAGKKGIHETKGWRLLDSFCFTSVKISMVNLPTWGQRIIRSYGIRFQYPPLTFYVQNIWGWGQIASTGIHVFQLHTYGLRPPASAPPCPLVIFWLCFPMPVSQKNRNPSHVQKPQLPRHLILIEVSKSDPSTHEKKRTIHSHWLRSPIQHQDSNKSNLGCFQTFWKKRKEMITMLSTKNGMQEQCISPKDTLSVPAAVLSSVLLPLFSLSENYWHELQIAKNLCTTHPHADQPGHSDYHILQFKPCNEKSSLCHNQRSRRNSHSWFAHSLLCAKCPLNCLRPQDLQGNQNFISP